jgi:hypothetical protein
MSTVARKHGLSLFASPRSVRSYERKGLPVETTPPTTSMGSPTTGAKLKGRQWLVASASDTFGVAKVEFRITGGTLTNAVVSSASKFSYGWLGAWDTTTVPNGPYALQSVAFSSGGRMGHSAGVMLTVENP